jgi:hypothetical protein
MSKRPRQAPAPRRQGKGQKLTARRGMAPAERSFRAAVLAATRQLPEGPVRAWAEDLARRGEFSGAP